MKGNSVEKLRPSLRANLAAQLRDEIIRGAFKPGEHLQEVTLAATYGVSRTPIREALHCLEREGFLTAVPSLGLFVRQLTRDEVSQIYPIVMALERLAISHAGPPSAEEATALEGHNFQLDRSRHIVEPPQRAVVRLQQNNAWHLGVAALARNDELCRLLSGYYQRMGRYVLKYWMLRPDLEVNTDEHRAILDAVTRQEHERAARLLDQHNEGALERIVVALEPFFTE